MNASERRHSHIGLLAFGVGFSSLMAMGTATAQVGPGTTGIDDSGNYRQEVQACRTGKTAEDQATCLREAKSAQADRKKGTLTNSGNFEANALARCDVFKDSQDKDACRGRVVGHATLSGSVAGGGLLRELETTVPASQTASERTDTQSLGGPQGSTNQAPSAGTSSTPSEPSGSTPSPAPSTTPSQGSPSMPETPPSQAPYTAPGMSR